MRRSRFLGKKKHQNEDMVLQITSMADIFTILLVFLLKSFSAGASSISTNDQLALPEAISKDKVVEATKVEILAESVLIDDKPVSNLKEYRFSPSDIEADGTPRSLNAAFIVQRDADRTKTAETAEPLRLMVMADRKTPYATLHTVLSAASNNGFGDFKLVVVGE